MKRGFIVAATLGLLIGGGPGWAQPGQGAEPGRRDANSQPPQERGAKPPARPAQLTPDERRQLRRDISDHGREIYPQQRPAPKADPRDPGQGRK
jgi:hypothetical protein